MQDCLNHLLADGEDEMWSPASVGFTLVAAKLARLSPTSLICDLGAGAAVSSIAVAIRTGATVYAVDSCKHAILSITERASRYGVSNRINAIQIDVNDYIEYIRKDREKFDLVILEGGICGIIGHSMLLHAVRDMLNDGGVVVVSGTTYVGVTVPPGTKNRIIVEIPKDVREFYENTRYTSGLREILQEDTFLQTIRDAQFSILVNFRCAQNHWASYFERMQRMAAENRDVAKQYPGLARLSGIDEAFYNLRGQAFISYSVAIAACNK
jgi:predicted O-methyltransferase YrrM